MIIKNPVVRGVYPDPSVCYCPDNGKYYMVNSSFEYFPGVPIHESDDLVNWTHVGHALTKPNQVDLKKIVCSGGVYAPTVRYHKGRFYMVTTNDTYFKNFYVYTDDIYGEWSDPIFVDQGGIDPSLYFEGDKTYFMSNGTDPADGMGCIYQCEINVETGEKLTESKPIWKGNGGRFLESPHLYKFGDTYYITAAEGGTEYGHMITYARGKSPYGPFENYPGNPVVTNRNLGGPQSLIQGIGHGDLITTPEGENFIICLGFRQMGVWTQYHSLGREVFLVPVTWREDGWFEAGINGTVRSEMDMKVNCKAQELDGRYDVSIADLGENSARWVHLREYDATLYKFGDDEVTLIGQAITMDDVDCPTFLGVRQSEFETDLTVTIDSDATEAGISYYLSNDHHYDVYVSKVNGEQSVSLRLHIGDAIQVVKSIKISGEAKLHVISKEKEYRYYFYCDNGAEEELLGSAAMKYLSSEVAGGFTGTVMGMYVTCPEGRKATFRNLKWTQITL